MNYKALPSGATVLSIFAVAALFVAPALGQGRGGGPAGPPPSPKDAAPMDLTGYWVSRNLRGKEQGKRYKVKQKIKKDKKRLKEKRKNWNIKVK